MAANESPVDASVVKKKPSQILHSFLKKISKNIDTDLKVSTDETSQFLLHCKKRCCDLLESCCTVDDITQDMTNSILRKTAHMVLDYTYLDETLMVDKDFPAENAVTRIASIQGQLDNVFQVAKECFEQQTCVESLGEELVECIHWRKGALLYMYCHTAEGDGRATNLDCYTQTLEQGVRHLEKMLSTRFPINIPDTVGEDDTLQLFSQGIYSDTHLLAMMYAAEMCYWHQKSSSHTGSLSQKTGGSTEFCAQRQGLRHLHDYLKAVRGPLKGQGWSTDRAEEIVKYLGQDV